MSEIFLKLARLGQCVKEVYLPDSGEEATVEAALQAAGVTPQADEEIRVGGESASLEMILHEGDIITLVPKIRGGAR